MKRAWLLFLVVLGTTTLAQAEESAWKLVWRSEAASSHVSLAGQVRTMIAVDGAPRQGTAQVWVAYGKTRFDYTVGTRHWSMLDDGERLIRLQPDTKRARIRPRPQLAFDRAVAERNYLARRVGTQKLLGRPVEVVEIVSRKGGGRVWRLWLDRATSFVLKRERLDPDGRVASSTEFVSVDFRARPARRLFELPAGYTQVGERDASRAIEHFRAGSSGRICRAPPALCARRLCPSRGLLP